MKRLLVIVVAAAFLALSIASEASSAVPVLGPEKEKPAKWEYGLLTVGGGCHWNVPDEAVSAKSWRELAEKVKAPVAIEKPNETTRATERIAIVAVLNHLGKQGWELVSHNSDNSQETYVFKRRILSER